MLIIRNGLLWIIYSKPPKCTSKSVISGKDWCRSWITEAFYLSLIKSCCKKTKLSVICTSTLLFNRQRFLPANQLCICVLTYSKFYNSVLFILRCLRYKSPIRWHDHGDTLPSCIRIEESYLIFRVIWNKRKNVLLFMNFGLPWLLTNK